MNNRIWAVLILVVNPFITLLLAWAVYQTRGYFAIGGEIFVPLLLIFAALRLSLEKGKIRR